MIETTTCEAEAGGDVFWLKIGEFLEHLLASQSVCQQVEDVGDPNAHAANARAVPVAYVTSWGRYPIPLKAKDLEIPEGFEISMKIYEDLSVEVHSSDQKNLKAAEALMTKLLDQLKT